MSLGISKGAALKGYLYTKGLHFKLKPGSRLIAAMLGKPDYIPIVSGQIHEHAATVAHADPKRFFLTDGRYSVATQYYVSKWYGLEMPMGMPPDAYDFEVEALGGKLLKSGKHMPSIDQSNPLIKTPEDLRKVKVPIQKDRGRIPFVFDAIHANKELGGYNAGFICAPFSFLCGVHSYVGMIRDIRRNPEFVHTLFSWAIDEVLVPYIQLTKKETGSKTFMAADAWSVWPNVDKKILTDFIFPANRDLTRKAKKLGMTVSTAGTADYCEENPAKFDPEIMKWCWYNSTMELMGRPLLNMGMGKPELWPMNIMKSYIKEHTTKKWAPPLTAAGSASLVRDSTPQQLADYAKRLIDNFGHNGRILFSFVQITADTPSVNVHSFVHAVNLCGKFPMPDNLNKIKFEMPKFEPYDVWFKREQAEGRVIEF